MASDLRPEDIRDRKFGLSRRGYDRSEVKDYLAGVANRIAELEGELGVVAARLEQLGITDLPDFKREIDALGAEIQAVLSAALTAAEGMRSRAQVDARDLIGEAEATSTAARGDAWNSGSELLVQAEQTAEAMLAEAREDALFIRAEAEQDAKRLVTEARRQADDMVRSSREEGEKIVVIAKAESEAILEGARQSAEKAQERARALENRRAELLGELEEAESAIRDLEATRSGPAVGPRVTAGDEATIWPEDDGAIRILPAAEPAPPEPSATVDAEEMAAEVAEMRSAVTMPQTDSEPIPEPEQDLEPETEPREEAEVEPAPEPESELEPEPEPVPEPEPEPASEPAPEPEAELDVGPEPSEPLAAVIEDKVTVMDDDPSIGALFAKLREPIEPEPEVDSSAKPLVERVPAPAAEAEPVTEAPAPRDEVEPEPARTPLAAVPDIEVGQGFERRDRALLPVENTGLRGLKRRIVELQNRVLEELRKSDGAYRPGRKSVTSMMGDELDDVLRNSFEAGFAAAAESLGVPQPQLTGGPNQGAAENLARDLHSSILTAIERGSEGGSRRLSSDVSRVFRSWRTDEAERHVRVAARRAYNDGLLSAYRRLGVAEVEYAAPGRPCGECTADSGVSWAPIDDAPPGVDTAPLSPACSALVVPKGSDGFDSRPEQ